MLKDGTPNPLNVHQLREVVHLPPHFEQVIITLSGVTNKQIKDWLYENLQGRFYVGNIDVVADSGKVDRKQIVGFELHGEATYFSLVLPSLDKNLPL